MSAQKFYYFQVSMYGIYLFSQFSQDCNLSFSVSQGCTRLAGWLSSIVQASDTLSCQLSSTSGLMTGCNSARPQPWPLNPGPPCPWAAAWFCSASAHLCLAQCHFVLGLCLQHCYPRAAIFKSKIGNLCRKAGLVCFCTGIFSNCRPKGNSAAQADKFLVFMVNWVQLQSYLGAKSHWTLRSEAGIGILLLIVLTASVVQLLFVWTSQIRDWGNARSLQHWWKWMPQGGIIPVWHDVIGTLTCLFHPALLGTTWELEWSGGITVLLTIALWGLEEKHLDLP